MKYYQVEKCQPQLTTRILAVTSIIISDLNVNAVTVLSIMLEHKAGYQLAGALRLCLVF